LYLGAPLAQIQNSIFYSWPYGPASATTLDRLAPTTQGNHTSQPAKACPLDAEMVLVWFIFVIRSIKFNRKVLLLKTRFITYARAKAEGYPLSFSPSLHIAAHSRVVVCANQRRCAKEDGRSGCRVRGVSPASLICAIFLVTFFIKKSDK